MEQLLNPVLQGLGALAIPTIILVFIWRRSEQILTQYIEALTKTITNSTNAINNNTLTMNAMQASMQQGQTQQAQASRDSELRHSKLMENQQSIAMDLQRLTSAVSRLEEKVDGGKK